MGASRLGISRAMLGISKMNQKSLSTGSDAGFA